MKSWNYHTTLGLFNGKEEKKSMCKLANMTTHAIDIDMTTHAIDIRWI